jgi:hypothetical protein
MAQLSNYIQNLIHPHSEEEEIEEEGIEEENIEEAQDINVNEASQPKNVKRMVGSARYRRQLNKRVDGHQDDQGFWHYSVPKHKPEHTPPPKQDEASSASPELEEFAIEQDLSEQAMQNSVEMEAFPFFPPPFDPIFWGALLPDKIKKRIASKVKEKVDEVAAHDPKLKEGLEKASEFIDKATKAIEDFKEKHHLGAGEPSAAPSPTS